MIDLVIPTLWKCEKFTKTLQKYVTYDSINEIIVIDNSHIKKPKDEIFNHKKIKLHKTYRNLYVNAAWNLGVALSSSKIVGLFSDDTDISKEVFDKVCSLDFNEIDIVGANLSDSEEVNLSKLNFDKTKSIGYQHYGFGCCMFMPKEKYKYIPPMYKIWYGDDYLLHNLKNIYTININKKGIEMSKTINSFQKSSYIHKVIQMDIGAANRYLFK